VTCHTCDFVARLHSRTLRLWRSVQQTNMASSDSDDAASKSQRAAMKSHAATLSRDKIARVTWHLPQINIFCQNFMPICPVTKKCEFTVLYLLKKHAPFHHHFVPLCPRAPRFCHVRFEFGLHAPVKFYPDPLRFVGIICEKPITSKYILCCHAWQCTINTLVKWNKMLLINLNLKHPGAWGITKNSWRLIMT